ncbi:MAG TPA: YbfB/YjiJ family MFS transporter [Stellaceae bacterium]|nr:YbfB/YjiJ family MFS transporter [Stellaceae bacterium]
MASATGDRTKPLSLWRPAAAGLSASLIGIGLARFAYTPLIPALIAAGWFAPSAAAYLGAANLAGYLAGALLARPCAARTGAVGMLRAGMVLAVAGFFACAVPVSFLWYFLWRFVAGFSGGVLMVLAAPTVLPHVPPARRGLVGGAIFTGVGLGIALSGTLVPLLLRFGLGLTWCALGGLAAALTLLGWSGWPHAPRPARAATVGPAPHGLPLLALYGEYALNAVGLVPHMVFLVDYIARGLGEGVARGAQYWVVFGLGAVCGPSIAGHVADRIGFARALRLAFVLEAASVGLVAVATGPAALLVSSAVVGAFVPGIVGLVLGRAHELTHGADGAQRAWSFATIAFAAGQAVAAYAFSYLYAGGVDEALLFVLGAAALALALLLDLAVPVVRRLSRR